MKFDFNDIYNKIDCKNLIKKLEQNPEFNCDDIIEIRKFLKNPNKVFMFCKLHNIDVNEFIINMISIFPTVFTGHLIKFIRKNYNLNNTFF